MWLLPTELTTPLNSPSGTTYNHLARGYIMSVVESIGTIIVTIIIIVFLGGILYFTLFKAREFNQPMTARGIGICFLAGVLKLTFLLLAEYGYSGFNADWLNVALGIMTGVGVIMIMLGFGD